MHLTWIINAEQTVSQWNQNSQIYINEKHIAASPSNNENGFICNKQKKVPISQKLASAVIQSRVNVKFIDARH